jgi:release factor glutamine methyltransferase
MKPDVSPKQDLKTKNDSPLILLKQIQAQLSPTSASPYLDALVLLGHISGRSKSELIAHPQLELTPQQTQRLSSAVQQLQDGIPLPYVLGEWEFFKRRFTLTPDVLIPRPETEGLVSLALEWLEKNPQRRTCLEIGTGSGCIAITLAGSISDLQIIATDISSPALQVASANARTHKVQGQIQFLERDLFSGIDTRVDLLIANLPYIPTKKLQSLAVYQSEPTLALDGGQDGLHYIKEVLTTIGQVLNPGGAVFLELDEDCGAAALALAQEIPFACKIKLEQDLSGQDRYLCLQVEYEQN